MPESTLHRLRSFEPADAEWVYKACQDPEIQAWTTIPRPYLLEHATAYVEDSTLEVGKWVIEDISDASPVGVISIHSIDTTTGKADIGYWVAPWGRGRGAASQALNMVAREAAAFDTISTLSVIVAETNLASRATAEKSGFQLVGSTGSTCPSQKGQTPSVLYSREIPR